MPKWLDQMIGPTLMLWLLAGATGVAAGLADGYEMPKRAEVVLNVAWQFIVACWVLADARKRGRQLCYDYGSFVYFAWPVVVPVYLFQTRGIRAFLTLFCLASVWLVSAFIGVVVVFVREFAL